MNWTLIILLSLPGMLMGALSLRGWTQGIEPYLWISLSAFTVMLLVKNTGAEFFLTALLIGVLWGLFNAGLQFLFFDIYIHFNPLYAENFSKVPEGFNPRIFTLITGTVIGIITGLVLALLTWGGKKIFM